MCAFLYPGEYLDSTYEIDFDKNTISIEYYRKGKYHTKDKKLIKKGTD